MQVLCLDCEHPAHAGDACGNCTSSGVCSFEATEEELADQEDWEATFESNNDDYETDDVYVTAYDDGPYYDN